jgi:hypothetical protein
MPPTKEKAPDPYPLLGGRFYFLKKL